MNKHWTTEARRRILERWDRSDLPTGEFARRAGVSYSTLFRWRRELDASTPFIELVPKAEGKALTQSAAGSAAELDAQLEIVLPVGIVVRVGRDVNEALLERVVRSLS